MKLRSPGASALSRGWLASRRVVVALNSLPENNRFLRGLRAWVGFKQTGVPYMRPERMFGRTTNSFLRNVQWARQAILDVRRDETVDMGKVVPYRALEQVSPELE